MKYLLKLSGEFVLVDGEGKETVLDSSKITKTASGVHIYNDGTNIHDVEVEKAVVVKDTSDVPAAIKQIQDMVIETKRDRTEMRRLAASVEDLAKQRSISRPGFAFGGDDFVNKTADQIMAMPIKGFKLEKFGTDYLETPPTDQAGAKYYEFQRKADEVYSLSLLLNQPAHTLKAYKDFKNWATGSGLQKALSTSVSGEGSEWIPTGYSPRLFEKARLEMKVANLFERIPLPNATYVLPVQTADSTAYLVPENTSNDGTKIPASQPTSSNATFTAKKLAARVRVSDEANEDAVFPLLAFVERNVAQAIANAIETCMLNGDTTATHQDSNVTSAFDAKKAFKGLRKLASDKSATLSNSDAFPTTTHLHTLRAIMDTVYFVNPGNLAYIMGGIDYLHVMQDTTNVTTMEKYGPAATILTGELGRAWNIPIIVSEFQNENLNASGVYDGSTTDRNVLQIVHRPSFLWGSLSSGIRLERGRDIETQQEIVVASIRADFLDLRGSTAKNVANLYNIDQDAD